MRPRTSGGQISLMKTGPAGNAIPWPIPSTIRPPINATQNI